MNIFLLSYFSTSLEQHADIAIAFLSNRVGERESQCWGQCKGGRGVHILNKSWDEGGSE